MQEKHYLVPLQHAGSEKDLSHSIYAHHIEDAEDWFVDAKERMLDINNWRKFSGIADATFKLTDHHGHAVNRRARKGDHIRIDIPESGYDMDGGFFWAAIEAIEYDDYPDIDMETFAVRVRSCSSPLHRKDEGEPHNDATGTFVIERVGKILTSMYHGRNEEEPLHEGSPLMVLTINGLGLSDAQYAELVMGFLE